MGLAGQILIETAARGSEPVFVAPQLRLGGRDFATLARNMALHMVQKGVGRGNVVAVRSDDFLVSLGLVLAAGLLGCGWTFVGEEMAGRADLLLDTAPDGDLLPGAVRVDPGWAVQPMPEAAGIFPGAAEGMPWLFLAGESLTDAELTERFAAEAGAFDRPGRAVAGLGGPGEAPQLMLALATLYHGGVVVESAEPEDWQAEGVVLVAGRPSMVAECMAGVSGTRRFRELRLWGPRADLPQEVAALFDKVTETTLAESSDGDRAGAAEGPNLELLDHLLCEIDGVTDAAAFFVPKPGKPDRLTAFLTLAAGADLPRVTSEARIAALRLGGQDAVPKRILLTDALPRRPDGRVDRAACRDKVLAARARRGRARP